MLLDQSYNINGHSWLNARPDLIELVLSDLRLVSDSIFSTHLNLLELSDEAVRHLPPIAQSRIVNYSLFQYHVEYLLRLVQPLAATAMSTTFALSQLIREHCVNYDEYCWYWSTLKHESVRFQTSVKRLRDKFVRLVSLTSAFIDQHHVQKDPQITFLVIEDLKRRFPSLQQKAMQLL